MDSRRIGLAILQNVLVDFPADGIVMHPSDWDAAPAFERR